MSCSQKSRLLSKESCTEIALDDHKEVILDKTLETSK